MDSQLVDTAVSMLREREIRVHLVESRAGAVEKAVGIIRTGPVALSSSGWVSGLGLGEAMQSGGLEVFVARGDSLARRLEGAAWGITGAAAIAADTGSVVIAEDGGNDHMVSALPPAHLVLAGAGCIVPTLGEALSACRDLSRNSLGKTLARHISIISGPSATADIQGVLVKGMHGPLEVHVIIIRQDGE